MKPIEQETKLDAPAQAGSKYGVERVPLFDRPVDRRHGRVGYSVWAHGGEGSTEIEQHLAKTFPTAEPIVVDGGQGFFLRGEYHNWWVGGWGGPREQWDRDLLGSRLDLLPAHATYIINIEHWPTDVRRHGDTAVEQTIRKFRRLYRDVHAHRPDLNVGLYRMYPIRDYWSAISRDPARLIQWFRANQRLELGRDELGRFTAEGLGDVLDVVCPSIYDFYVGHTENDRRYVEANIEMARSLAGEREVLAFVMPTYHPGGETDTIPLDEWRAHARSAVDAGADVVVQWPMPRDGYEDHLAELVEEMS